MSLRAYDQRGINAFNMQLQRKEYALADAAPLMWRKKVDSLLL